MPKKKSSGCSKLLKAVQQNRFEDVAKILARGTSDINTRNKEGLTALSVCRNSQIAKLLISKGANVEIKDFDGYTPLARCLDLDLARILIESGADVNAKFGDGRTVLNEIAAGALCHIMVLLLSKGATTWGDCAIGTKFFSRLFQNFVLLPGTYAIYSSVDTALTIVEKIRRFRWRAAK
jgi:ankyrin repeat protein